MSRRIEIAGTLALLAACAWTAPAGAQQAMAQQTAPQMMAPQRMDAAAMERMMTGWSTASREAMAFMTQKYGPPAEMTASMALWNRTGPWKRTIISAMAIPHAFPGLHDDVMEQVIDYRVPPSKFDELAMYDGSVVVERTKGEMSARCDKEGANFLALNLANEIATGRRSPESARRKYAEEIMAVKAGRPTPYTQRLLFQPMTGSTMDPDRPAM
jgi:hypothetical protein